MAKILPHTCGHPITVTERYNGVQLAMVTPVSCPGCGERMSYNVLVNLQERRLDMPEQELSLYQRYLRGVRANPDKYIIIKSGQNYVTYMVECWLFAQELQKVPVKVNGYDQITITTEQVERLRAKFKIIEV